MKEPARLTAATPTRLQCRSHATQEWSGKSKWAWNVTAAVRVVMLLLLLAFACPMSAVMLCLADNLSIAI
jgi:hypothetical protein